MPICIPLLVYGNGIRKKSGSRMFRKKAIINTVPMITALVQISLPNESKVEFIHEVLDR